MTTKLGPEVEILPPETPSDRPSFRMSDEEREWLAAQAASRTGPTHPRSGRRPRRGMRIVAFTTVGAVAAFAGWQASYGYPAREALAGLSPSLHWLAAEDKEGAPPAPDPEQNNRIEQITRNVDRMAAEVAANQAQITHLTAGQEKITREILKLKVLVQSAYAASHRPQRHAIYYRY